MRKLKSILAYHGLTGSKLAKELGVSQNAISKKMQGHVDWKLKTDIVPMIEYLNSLSDKSYTVEEVFEELFEGR